MNIKDISSYKCLDEKQNLLKTEIQKLKLELETIENEIKTFEASLSARISAELIEEQELTIVYKKIKKAKKEKRLEQKKRGKNYKAKSEILPLVKSQKKVHLSCDQKEKKRLYRDAMLQVHPDKFSLNPDQTERATSITTKLIEIYQTGNLKEMKAFHAHIFSGNAPLEITRSQSNLKNFSKDIFLESEKEKILTKIEELKQRHTYKVLKTYENPFTYVGELKAFYVYRIEKLKKRTRKGL